jgi:hypothetical protein
MAVWTKRNSIRLAVRAKFGLPFLLINDVHGIWQGITGSAHDARMMLSSFPVSDDLPFSIGVEGHGVPDFSLVAGRSQASVQSEQRVEFSGRV